jgi:hypothetical protein
MKLKPSRYHAVSSSRISGAGPAQERFRILKAGQQGADIFACPVPGGQRVDREGVAHVISVPTSAQPRPEAHARDDPALTAREPVHVVSQRLGHASAVVTMTVTVHADLPAT